MIDRGEQKSGRKNARNILEEIERLIYTLINFEGVTCRIIVDSFGLAG